VDHVFDILLTALDMGAIEKYGFTDTDGYVHPVQDTAFADDLMSSSRTLDGLQRKADIVSAFCIIFGLQIVPKKLRAFRADWSPLQKQRPAEELTVHLKGWQPNPISIRTEGHCKYLGLLVDTGFNFDAEYSKIMTCLRWCLSTLGKKSASSRLKLAILMLHTTAKARYGGSLAALTPRQLEAMNISLAAFYRKIFKCRQSFPTALLFACKTDGGLELPMLSHQILEAKRRMVARARAPSTALAINGMQARAARLLGRCAIPGSEWAILPHDPADNAWEPWLSSLVSWMHSTGHCLSRRGLQHSELNCPLLDPLEPSSPLRVANVALLDKYGLACLGDILHPRGKSYAVTQWMDPASSADLQDLRDIRQIGLDALVRGSKGLASLPVNPELLSVLSGPDYAAQCSAKRAGRGGRFFESTTSRTRAHHLNGLQVPLSLLLRPGQCWFARDFSNSSSFNQQCIYEILGFVGNRDCPRSYWCRRWSLSASAVYVVPETEAGGAILDGQVLQWEDFVTPSGLGLQAILSRDTASLRSVDDTTSCVVSRKLRDYGMRRCSLPTATPRLGLEDVSELTPFLEAVRRLAAQGNYSLCTDGSSDTVRRPSEHLFREPGRYVAGAGIVAVPAPGLPLGTLLPSLFIPDLHAATDCAFPLEYIAAVIARFTASMVPGCQDIFVDCKSVIDLLGHLPGRPPTRRLTKSGRLTPAGTCSSRNTSTPIRTILCASIAFRGRHRGIVLRTRWRRTKITISTSSSLW